MKTREQINEMRADADDWVMASRTDVPSMSYEEGVAAALAWVLGDSDEAPIENQVDL